MTKISACLVVHNEEKVIGRCLDSIKDIIDDIVVVHDGKCTDATMDIVGKYTKKLYVFPKVGNAEPHRHKSFKLAKNDWILVLDADEVPSKPLKRFLRNFKQEKGINGYKFIFLHYGNGKPFKHYPLNSLKVSKLFLLNRNRIDTSKKMIVSEELHVSGEIKELSYVVEHRPPYNMFSLRYKVRKETKWAKLRARGLIKSGRASFSPFFYLIKAPISGLLSFQNLYLKGGFREGYKGFVFSFGGFWRYFTVNLFIFYYKLRGIQ